MKAVNRDELAIQGQYSYNPYSCKLDSYKRIRWQDINLIMGSANNEWRSQTTRILREANGIFFYYCQVDSNAERRKGTANGH
ncbi:hypothetical protein Y1Q_0001132 [Alligator mississippiensis]|uniref:Uncharacterized protein n=1 Tax=Alligator mississippiensis TaxID=8496 RepID=A0A151M3Y1_ALLMI|nr:hypothetical protein Y1Q_0001132 [Alligator mississippiensis]